MESNNKCLDWNPSDNEFFKCILPKVLLIGHDPRLQTSDTIAEYALFADYYFREQPKNSSEKRKYNFAKRSFDQVLEITNKKYQAEEIYVTNLCNEALRHAPKNKTVLIPASIAKKGVEHIKNILLENSSIELVLPMSQQVNYWLQFFGFYHTNTDYLDKAKPNANGVNNKPPYYQAVKQRESPFLKICGKVYTLDTGQKLIPILHTKQYGNGNFNGKLLPYKCNYDNLAKLFLEESLV